MKKLEKQWGVVQGYDEPRIEGELGSGSIRKRVPLPKGDNRLIYDLEELDTLKYMGKIYFADTLPVGKSVYDEEFGVIPDTYFPIPPVYTLVKNPKTEEIPKDFKQGDIVVRKVQRLSEKLMVNLCKRWVGEEDFEKYRLEIEQHYSTTRGICKRRKRTEEELKKYSERDERIANYPEISLQERVDWEIDEILEYTQFHS